MHAIPWTLPFAALLGALGRKSGDELPGDADAATGDGGSDCTSGEGPGTRREDEREEMIRLIASRGVRDPRVLAALRKVARHDFVPASMQSEAYADRALPIGGGQTISQPYIVALMTEALELTPRSRVLEIGTGSAYQTAVLCELAVHVTTIELRPELAESACALLARLGYADVDCRSGDGSNGAPDRAPFDAIIVTAAPEIVPKNLLDQLAIGGRMCIPVGATPSEQSLLRIRKLADGSTTSERIANVRFVPLISAPDA